MFVLATRDTWWMAQVDAVLAAEGIPGEWAAVSEGMLLDVPTSELERITDALSEQLGDEIRRRRAAPPAADRALWLEPGVAFAVGLAAVTVAFSWVTGPFDLTDPWFARGALIAERALAGEWWRLITAATLHGDGLHAASNAGFFLVLAWAAAERFGPGVALFACLLTAAGGFGVSLAVSDAAITVGASGGLFGLLGAAAGHGLRSAAWRDDPRRYRLRVVSSAILLLGFTAFSERANVAAHLGGFVAGALLGLLMPLRAPAWPTQVAAAAAACAAIALAWRLAGL